MMNEKEIIRISSPYVTKEKDGLARLCADVTIHGKTGQLWYGVEERYENALTKDRLDPFAVTLLHIAMHMGADIVCEAPVSARLLYKINNTFIPALTFADSTLKDIKVIAKPAEACETKGAVGCSCSFGLDSLYTIRENRGGEYPITHICLFNAGTFEGENGRELFRRHYGLVKDYAEKLGLKSLAVDTNLHEVLNERYMDIGSERQLGVILALQGLFGAYHYSSSHLESEFHFDMHEDSSYDPLSIDCFTTDSLCLFLSGASVSRIDKLLYIADHKEEAAMMHPCFKKFVWEKNCGKCMKCIRDMLPIYAVGKTDCFSEAFDFEGFEKKIPTYLAFVMARSENDLMKSVLEFWKDRGLSIPKKSYVYEAKFRSSMKNLEENGL